MRSRSLLASLGFVGALVVVSCCHGPKLTTTQKQGKKIYESLCNKCHKLIDPKAYSEKQWNMAVDKYGVQLQLNYEERSAVKAYLAFARKESQ